MAKRRRQVRSSRSEGGFLRGLVFGLAVAAGVHVYHAGLPGWFDGPDDRGAAPSGRVEPPKTNFDFYRLLPKTEVRVDDPAVPGGTPRPAERTAARPSTTAGGQPPREPALPASRTREYRVQVGSFRDRKEADRLRAELALGGFESSLQTIDAAGATWHRVMLGPFRGREAAEAAKARVLTARGIDARIVPEKS